MWIFAWRRFFYLPVHVRQAVSFLVINVHRDLTLSCFVSLSGWLQRWWCVRPWRTRPMITRLISGLWGSPWSSSPRSNHRITSSTRWGCCWRLPSLNLPPWNSHTNGEDAMKVCTIPAPYERWERDQINLNTLQLFHILQLINFIYYWFVNGPLTHELQINYCRHYQVLKGGLELTHHSVVFWSYTWKCFF